MIDICSNGKNQQNLMVFLWVLFQQILFGAIYTKRKKVFSDMRGAGSATSNDKPLSRSSERCLVDGTAIPKLLGFQEFG